MSATPWLWNEIHDFFDTADGSLPMIYVNYSDTRAVAAGYALLKKLAFVTYPESECFYSIPGDEERPLDSVSNPATLVVSGLAHPFHVIFGGISIGGAIIPDLGVFVFTDQLQLDYRMGADWGSKEVEALFALLSQLAALDPNGSLALEDGVLPEVADRFQLAWKKYSTDAA